MRSPDGGPPVWAPPGRLRAEAHIRGIFRAPTVLRAPAMRVHARWSGAHNAPRVTVVASRALGNAVGRNRAKRRLRGALNAVGVPPGWDLVVVARPTALTGSAALLRAQMAGLLTRLDAP